MHQKTHLSLIKCPPTVKKRYFPVATALFAGRCSFCHSILIYQINTNIRWLGSTTSELLNQKQVQRIQYLIYHWQVITLLHEYINALFITPSKLHQLPLATNHSLKPGDNTTIFATVIMTNLSRQYPGCRRVSPPKS